MRVKNAVSVTLNQNNLQFVEKIAKQEKKSKSEIVDRVLSMYRKFKLKKDVIAGFKSQTKADVQDAMSDFNNYLSIIER